ncbi:MAG: PorV/PorQ family protein [Candidatus Marinimicrobia bacterium]|nr:PorV/PorQ family protein [Candidatus Neomarinimicrobiota bacterium]
MKSKILILLILLMTGVSSQNLFPILGGQRVGTSVFTFLKIGVSARAAGMSEAVVALNQDAASIYYNPGSVAQFARTEFSASRIQWPADINYDFFSFARHLFKRHYIGVSAGILHMEPMQETTEFMPHGTGNYFVFQNRFVGLTYGARMTDRFSFGVTFKQVQENLAGSKMNGTLIDMGTFYWTGFRTLRFSAALSNFGPQVRPDGYFSKQYIDRTSGEEAVNDSSTFTEFSPPTVFRVGSAMNIIDNEFQVLTMALQLNHPVDNSESIVLGAEYTLFKTLSLRAGYKFNRVEEDFSMGAGLYIPLGSLKLRVDYAYTNFTYLTDPSRLTIGLSF